MVVLQLTANVTGPEYVAIMSTSWPAGKNIGVVFLTAANHNVRNAHAALMKRSYSVVGFRLTG